MPPKRQVTDNLGIRQRTHNARVHEAFVSNVKFEDIKDAAESSDIDKLFKIDLAARYKHVNYILEVLKSADSLHTTRALKMSVWLFDNKHTHIINPEYLHNEIFSFTSLKMKKKILTHVALHVRNEERAAIFYSYCEKWKLMQIALKFAVFTSEAFKLTLLTEKRPSTELIVDKDKTYLNHFLRKSFTLLTTFIELIQSTKKKGEVIVKFQHWYNYDPNKYLDLVEKYAQIRFDATFSDIIIKKHKNRVLAKPKFYINLLKQNALVKQSSAEDAKVYAVALLPLLPADFWSLRYYSMYRNFLELIPHEETYDFLKRIFNERYPDEEFETTAHFYHQEYYKFMTKEQQEVWAWNHIKSEKQILGVGRDYIWYEYVNFKDAFEALKNLIMVTKDFEKRNEMLRTLLKSAKTNSELETLFCYYQMKHLHEARKAGFLSQVQCYHNIFEFNDSCWQPFYYLLLSMDIYNKIDYDYNLNNGFKTIILLFFIVNEQEIPEVLLQYALEDFRTQYIDEHLMKLTDKKRTILYEYFHSMYINKILEYKYAPIARKDETQLRKYFENVVNLMKIYHQKEEIPLPPRQTKHVHQPERKKRYRNRLLSDRELIRRLKEDSYLVIETLPEVTSQLESRPFKINTFLKKIKLYFADDISKNYLELFESNISKDLSKVCIAAAVNGVFLLGDMEYKVDFMNTYAPQNIKVDYNAMDPHDLRILKAICRYFCRSQPPVPLANVLMYLKSDFAKHCLHVFNVYLSNLSFSLCLNFVEEMLDTPVSLKKHGLRLAFKCLDTMNLKKLVIKTWKKTKNVSIRSVIYKALYKKIEEDRDKELFEVLKTITLELGPDDEDEIFDMLVSNQLAAEFLGDYNEAAWKAVGVFKDKEPFIQRKENILQNIQKYLALMREEFLRTVVLQNLEELFEKNQIVTLYSSQQILQKLVREKWELVKTFIIHTTSHAKTPTAYVHLATHITQVCIESWNQIYVGKLVYQNLCFDFIRGLQNESIKQTDCNPRDAIPVFETILNELQTKLPLPAVYVAFWDLNLTIIHKKVIQENVINSELCVNYGKEVGKLVVELVKDGKYFTHMAGNIKIKIESHVEDFGIYLRNSGVCVSSATCLVKFGSGLIVEKSVETYVLATEILPEDGVCYEWDSYKDMITKISQMNDPNVQCAMHLKLRKKCE